MTTRYWRSVIDPLFRKGLDGELLVPGVAGCDGDQIARGSALAGFALSLRPIIEKAGIIAVGDYVFVRWSTPKGAAKQVRGQVCAVKPNKLQIKYMQDSSRGNSLSFSVKEIWRPLEQCKKDYSEPDAVPVSKRLEKLCHALAGKAV
jgi:hypothetical protein